MATASEEEPFQFTLWHAGVVTLWLCVCLALIVQLRGLGLLLAAILASGLMLYWRSGFKMLAEAATAILIILSLMGLLWPIVDCPRGTPARRNTCANNLKQLNLALQNYHDTYGSPRDLHVTQMASVINAPRGQGISSQHPRGAQVVRVDGSVQVLSDDVDPGELRAMLTIAAGDDASLPQRLERSGENRAMLVDPRERSPRRFQFGLIGLMAVMTLACLVGGAYHWFGPRPFIVLGHQLFLGLVLLPFAILLGLVLTIVLWVFGYR